MNLERVKKLIKQKENICLEFKKAQSAGNVFRIIIPLPGDKKIKNIELDNYIEKLFSEYPEKNRERLSAIISVVSNHPGIKSKELSEKIGLSQSGLKRYLKILSDAQIVSYVGSPRFGGYYLINH